MWFSPISANVQATNAAQYDGKSSPNQHIFYFWPQTDNVVDNDAIMAIMFIGTLKGVAFYWFRSLPHELHQNMARPENPVPLPISGGWYRGNHRQTPLDNLERRRICTGLHREVPQPFFYVPAGMPLPMLLQTCRHNFLDKVKIRMGAVKDHTWKELVEQADIAEKSAKKFESLTPKSMWAINNKSQGTTESFDTSALKVYGGTRSKKGNSNRTTEYQRQYSFKDKHVVIIFHLLNKRNKLKLSEARRSDEVG